MVAAPKNKAIEENFAAQSTTRQDFRVDWREDSRKDWSIAAPVKVAFEPVEEIAEDVPVVEET